MRLIRGGHNARWRGRGERAWVLILGDDDRDPGLLRLGDVLAEQLRRDLRLDEHVHLLGDAPIESFGKPRDRSLPVVDDKFESSGPQGLPEPKVDEAGE